MPREGDRAHRCGEATLECGGWTPPWKRITWITVRKRRRQAAALQGAARILRLGGVPQADGLWAVSLVDE
jgi:hypothetical protein